MSNTPQKKERKGIITLDPEDYFPQPEQIAALDLKAFLFHALIVKEDWFRQQVEQTDWTVYQGKVVCVYCSVDAVIPSWVYMVLASRLSGIAEQLYFARPGEGARRYWLHRLQNADFSAYASARVVVKGCGRQPASEEVFLLLAARLTPLVRSLQFGEPCSTVPVYKSEAS